MPNICCQEWDIIFTLHFVGAVTMQAQRAAPPDLHCKDKFLIQSTVVPVGTAEEDITSGMVGVCCGNLF